MVYKAFWLIHAHDVYTKCWHKNLFAIFNFNFQLILFVLFFFIRPFFDLFSGERNADVNQNEQFSFLLIYLNDKVNDILFVFFLSWEQRRKKEKQTKKQTKKREQSERKWDRLAQWGNLQRSGESRAIQSERKVLISIAGGWFCSSLSLFLFSKSSIFFCVSPSLLLCFVSTPFNWWQCENFSDSQQYNHSSDEKKKRFVSFVIFCFLFFLLLPRRGTKKKFIYNEQREFSRPSTIVLTGKNSSRFCFVFCV